MGTINAQTVNVLLTEIVAKGKLSKGLLMPVRKVKGGYRWGKSGKVYKTKKAAERQARAIYASGYKEKKRGRKK